MIDPQRSRKTWLVCLLLAFGTLALYWPVRGFDFVDYDDPDYILHEPVVKAGLSWWGLVWSVVDAHASNWHPLTWLSHMLDCQLFGLNAGAHHLVNVLFHCANAALLFLALRKLTGAFWRSALAAAVFAWHPLRVESVAWISERKDVLSGFFFMLTLWAYGKFAENSKLQVPSSKKWFRWTLVVFTLGLLSKPMLVTLPLVLLLLDFWPLNRFADCTPKKLLWEKAPFFFLALAISVITFLAQRYGGSVVSLQSLGPAARIQFALSGYLGYLEKILWPRDLAVLYLRPTSVPAALIICAAAVLSAITFFAAANVRRRPYLLVGWLWFCGMLLPVSGLVQAGPQFMADRYTYLSAIGFSVMLIWGGHELAAAFFAERTRNILVAVIAAVVLTTGGFLTRKQLGYWRNTQTLMESALKLDPNNDIAHHDLGKYLLEHGQKEEAEYHFQREREILGTVPGGGQIPTSK